MNQSCVLRGSRLPKTVNIMGRCIIVCSNADITGLVFLEHGHYETLGLCLSLCFIQNCEHKRALVLRRRLQPSTTCGDSIIPHRQYIFSTLKKGMMRIKRTLPKHKDSYYNMVPRKLPKYVLSERKIMSHQFL